MSFHCPKCDGITGVKETRCEIRKRLCRSCGLIFFTHEIEYEGPPGKIVGDNTKAPMVAYKLKGL